MNPEILSQLKDVHVPGEPSWWPLAWGYYLVFVIIILLVFMGYFYVKKQKIIWDLRKYINKEFKNIEQEYAHDKNISALQNKLVALIRRLALRAKLGPRADLSLCAEKLWPKNPSNKEFIELLESDRFKKTATINAPRLLSLAKKKFKKCTL